MTQFVKMFRGKPKEKKNTCQQGEVEKLQEREEFLMKKRAYLETEIEQEFTTAKTNSRKNRRVALQALRRKKWCEKQLKKIDCAIQAIKSAHENINMVNKVNDLIKDFDDEHAESVNMSDGLYTSVSSGLHFDEDELLAELERLEKNLDVGLVENDSKKERVSHAEEQHAASLSHPSDSEEDEVEDQLDYLRRWIKDLPSTHNRPRHTPELKGTEESEGLN